jgi:hypothetical protein
MYKRIIVFWGIFAIFISGVPFYLYRRYFGDTIIASYDKWAQFGDFIGGVLNPFIALFSFIALLLTLWYQSKEISKNDNSRKVDEIISSLQLLEKTIEPKMEHILSRHYTLPDKDKYSYRMAESLSSDLILCRNFLTEISVYSKSNSFIDLYKYKYLDIIKILHKRNYISKELKNFFAPAEE